MKDNSITDKKFSFCWILKIFLFFSEFFCFFWMELNFSFFFPSLTLLSELFYYLGNCIFIRYYLCNFLGIKNENTSHTSETKKNNLKWKKKFERKTTKTTNEIFLVFNNIFILMLILCYIKHFIIKMCYSKRVSVLSIFVFFLKP